jgi:hypothetical protein
MSSNRIPENVLKYQSKRDRSFGNPLEIMETLCSVISVTRLSRPDGERDDGYDDDDDGKYSVVGSLMNNSVHSPVFMHHEKHCRTLSLNGWRFYFVSDPEIH